MKSGCTIAINLRKNRLKMKKIIFLMMVLTVWSYAACNKIVYSDNLLPKFQTSSPKDYAAV